ncbi:MAG: phenylalanine--tRNA ligase subunit beta [Parcubacteria group bacterium]|nr:phenylalanine--tRNA ligase subunit beta [Parcubacteria group bacterium]
MKISRNWLNEYVNIKSTKPTKVGETLTMGIAEVEGVQELGAGLDDVVVGEMKEIKKHPNADKLFVSQVDVGEAKPRQVIFGQVVALKVGDKLPIALAPAKLPGGMKVKKTKLRGVDSAGMCCLNSELGILDQADDVNFFPKSIKNGTKIAKALGLDDAILEIDNKSLTHRADLFCHVGIARELAALLSKKLTLPKLTKPKAGTKYKLNITVKDKKLCYRYAGIILDSIKISPSPDWMQAHLSAAGMRPINNVVDITNYVMLEYGQPLHAFDVAKLKSKKEKEKSIVVRAAKKNETITTLDGETRKLSEKVIVIADEKEPVAIAGIMGGASTEVSEKTTTIAIESANFNETLIRKASQELGLRTEGSIRHEKGLSLDLPEQGLLRAIDLLQKHAGAKIVSKVTDTLAKKLKPATVKLDLEYLNKLVGVDIPKTKVSSILKSLEFKVKGQGKTLDVEVPIFRTDIAIPEDLIEEVARVYGYDNVTPQEITGVLEPVEELPDMHWGDKITEVLVGAGFTEMQNYSFYGEKLLRRCLLTSKDHIELANPMSEDLQYLRTSLLPWLFYDVAKNIREFDQINLFEIGHVYFPGCESKALSGVMLGNKEKVFYDLKGVIELLLKKLNISYQTCELARTADCEYWNMYAVGRSLQYMSGKDILGTLSLLDQRVATNFNIKGKKLAFFSFSIDQLAQKASSLTKYQPLPKFPPVTLDIALVVKQSMPAGKIMKFIQERGRPLLEKVELFDVYSGKQLDGGQKNLAFHLTYRAQDRTLQDKEVEAIQQKLVGALENELGARVRK